MLVPHYNNRRAFLFFMASLHMALGLFSQNENKIWYFGNQAGMNFMTSPPTNLTNSNSQMNNLTWACASISDANGNLLFYTNGITVWNQQHQIMANGGYISPCAGYQSALIVKKPGNNSIYYIISNAQSQSQIAVKAHPLRRALINYKSKICSSFCLRVLTTCIPVSKSQK